MEEFLQIIQDDYAKLCNTEYVFMLDDNSVVNLEFKKEYLPHLIGLHKLHAYFSEIRQMIDKNDINVTPKNIFEILQNNHIDYNTLKSCMGWDIHLENRMSNFTYDKVKLILKTATMFSYIYVKGKTKNKKAKYVLIEKPYNLFLQLYIGYDNKIKRYYPNSFVANSEKDSNLSRKTLKIIKTEIYSINSLGRSKVETIEHKKIRDISHKLKENLKVYNLKNSNIYKLANEDEPYEEILNEVNNLVKQMKVDYDELIKYVNPDTFFNSKSNDKLGRFFKVVNAVKNTK